jgi:hypothetical protein
METIVMTLLVRRVPEEDDKCRYAAQIALPRELTLGAASSLTSVRMINRRGVKASVLETTSSYRPQEWRAASLGEQAEFAIRFNGNPPPWPCVMRSLAKNVYDYPGGGDRGTNNGQVWDEIDNSNREWTDERKLKGRCQEELDTEWNKRLSQVKSEQFVSDRVQGGVRASD